MANKVIIDVEARFVDKVTGKASSTKKVIDDIGKSADKAKKSVDNLGKSKVNPKVNADSSKFDKTMNKVQSRLNKFMRSKAAAVLHATDRATEKISAAWNKAKNFAKTYSAKIVANGSSAINTIDKVTSGARNIAGKVWRGTVKIVDYATAPIRKITSALFNLKTLLAAVAAGFAAQKFIIQPINLADAYSSALIGFSTLLGDSAGQQMMNDLDEFAKATPFKSSEVISQSQRMLAMGWDAKNIIDDMRTIGDAAAATGKGEQGLQQIVTALSQIKTKGRLSTEELNQLAEAGVSAKRYIAEGLGYGSGDEGIAKMTKDLENGAIASDKALGALLSGMKEYEGMMDKTANETVSGLKSQIEDTFEINIFRRWGQGLQDGAKSAFGSIVTLLGEAEGSLEKFGDTVYEVGKTISNFLADKLQKAVERITNITDTFEFQNADLGGKLKMLWKGVIVDPLTEWWENGGREKTVQAAGKIGKFIGETLSRIILSVLGITDLLKDDGVSESGMSVAQSFAKGFVEGFDVSAITKKLAEAISNVWNALPWWGKALVIGYGGTKVGKGIGAIAQGISGIMSFAGGIKKFIGSPGNAMVNGSGLLNILSGVGYKLSGGAAGSKMSGGMAALKGAGAVAGGITMATGLIHAGSSAYGAYKGFSSGDKHEGWANVASGGGTLAGMGIGAAIGTAIGGPLGTLIGGGLGTIAGWLFGDAIAKNIRAAKYESEEMQEAIKSSEMSSEELAEVFEKAKWKNAKEHFGDIKLTMSEIERLANQIVFGDKQLKKMEAFSKATETAQANLQNFTDASTDLNRWNWKASLGVEFNEDEREQILTAVEDYIINAEKYVEDKHYELTAAVDLLMDPKSKGAKLLTEKGNKWYTGLQKEMDEVSKSISDLYAKALEDGIISADESKAIMAAQQKLADIMQKVSNAEADAQLDLISLKFNMDNISKESFDNLHVQIGEALQASIDAADQSYTTVVANAKLMLEDGAINATEYETIVKQAIEDREVALNKVRVKIQKFELGTLADAYSEELGEGAYTSLQTALEKSLKENIDPLEWTDEELAEILGVEELKGETAGVIKDALSGLKEYIDALNVDSEPEVNVDPKTNTDGMNEKIASDVEAEISGKIMTTLGIDVTGEPNVVNTVQLLQKDFGIPEEQSYLISLMLTGNKEILNHVDVVAEEFGISEKEAEDIIWMLYGHKSIQNMFGVEADEFGIPESVAKTLGVNIEGKKIINGYVTVGEDELVPQSKVEKTLDAYVGADKNITNTVKVTADDFGIPDSVSKTVSVIVKGVKSILGFGSDSDGNGFRGGLVTTRGIAPGFSQGGYVHGGAQLITVAEEGDPEVIIPLSPRRRERAHKLWAQTGKLIHADFGANRYATGGFVGVNESGGGYKINRPPEENTDNVGGGQNITINLGGVNVNITVKEGQNVLEAIEEQSEAIAEAVASVINQKLAEQFQNMPTKKGA